MIWHSTDTDEILMELDTDENCGLLQSDVLSRQAKYSKNVLTKKASLPYYVRLLKFISNPLLIALIIAGIFSAAIGIVTNDNSALLNGIAILICVVVSDFIYSLYEQWTQMRLNALDQFTIKTARVIRESKKMKIPSSELVPGDILIIRSGDLIPADARIIQSAGLKCNEFVLSNDTTDVLKNAQTIADDIAPIEQRSNMIYAGCCVTAGKALAVVTEIGDETEIGKIHLMKINSERQFTPVQVKIAQLTKSLSLVITVVCVFVFIVGFILNLWSTNNFLKIFKDNLLISLCLAAAAIPNFLPKTVICSAIIGIQRMLKKNAVATDIESVEKLSEISLICADKTGTITKSNMQLEKVYDGNEIIDLTENKEISQAVSMILKVSAACCDVSIKYGSFIGDETEIALINGCKQFTGVSKEDLDYLYTRMGDIPFDSQRKMMTTINMIDGEEYAIVKGAPDVVLSKCTSGAYENAKQANAAMCDDGLRVLAVAMKPLGLVEQAANPTSEEVECNLRFIGLVGLNDPPRTGVITSINKCRSGGIKTVMFTGDQFRTAVSVAKKAGILTDEAQAITGEAVSGMSDDELKQIISNISVFARLTPEDKTRIVNIYKSLGYKVAVTGDDGDDVPALNSADLSIGMAESGNDIALNNCDIQILDDSFESITTAIEEGRGIYKNIRKISTYILAGTFAILFTVLFGTIIFGVAPLAPQQILALPLFCILPSVAIATEKVERRVMYNKPRQPSDYYFAGRMGKISLIQGFVISAFAIIAYTMGITAENAMGSNAVAYTLAFGVLAFSMILNVFVVKRRLIFANADGFNKFHIISSAIAILFVILLMTTPVRYLFCLEVLTAKQWWLIVFMALLNTALCELVKLLRILMKNKNGGKTNVKTV